MLENKFFKSTLYFSIISLITTIIWFFGLESIGMPIFTAIAVAILILNKNGIHILPFLLNMLFMISRTEWSIDTIPIYLYILPALLILAMVFHMVKNKTKLFDGKLKYPLLMLLTAMLLSTINAETFNIGYIFFYFIGIFYLFIYFFFKGSLKGDNLEYLIKLFAVLGVMISIQILIYYIEFGSLTNMFLSGNIFLGWGLGNFAATYLIIFTTTTFYYFKKLRLKFYFYFIILFELVMLIFTLSRGAILAFSVTSIFLFIYLLYKTNNIPKFYIYTIINIFILIVFLSLDTQNIIVFNNRMFMDFFDDNNRFALWIKAWNLFLEHPLFGNGIFSEVNENYFKLYHNTILHTLATLGIFGFIALIWQFLIILKTFLKCLNEKTSILLIALIGANIHGMIDNVYYMPQFMIIFFIIISAVENSSIENSLKTEY
jgi:O-antigen ligase